jgi:uncharacterized protein YcfL
VQIIDDGKANADVTLLIETSVHVCYRSSWYDVDGVELVVCDSRLGYMVIQII